MNKPYGWGLLYLIVQQVGLSPAIGANIAATRDY